MSEKAQQMPGFERVQVDWTSYAQRLEFQQNNGDQTDSQKERRARKLSIAKMGS